MIAVTVLFSVLMLRCCKNKVVSFIRCWLMLGFIGVISVPIIYGAIRYMPTLHLHPLYFEGEYSINRVQPGEPRDSMKYITFEDAMRTNVGRVFYKIPKLKEYFDLFIPLTVHAAEPEDVKETEFLFSQEEEKDGIDPIELRKRIQTYYFERLNILGHTNDYEVAQLTSHSNAPHAHNVFIQMAFLYGVPSGILFVLMVLSFIPGCIGLMKKGEDDRVCLISCFVLSFVVFGLFEIDWMCGQLPFTMLFILFRDVVRKNSVDNHMQYNC